MAGARACTLTAHARIQARTHMAGHLRWGKAAVQTQIRAPLINDVNTQRQETGISHVRINDILERSPREDAMEATLLL